MAGKGKSGPDKIEFSAKEWKQMADLAEHMWSAEEVAGFFGISVDTLERRIKEEYGQKWSEWCKPHHDKFRGALRSAMASKALKERDKGMQIYLSKNYLGMTDKTDIDMKGNVTIEIKGKFAKL